MNAPPADWITQLTSNGAAGVLAAAVVVLGWVAFKLYQRNEKLYEKNTDLLVKSLETQHETSDVLKELSRALEASNRD